MINTNLMLAASVLALATGQVLFKMVSLKTETLMDIATNKSALLLFISAGIIYSASTLLWITALRNVPLNYAYLFVSGGFIIVPVASFFIFGEHLTLRFFAGSILIILGIWLAAS